MKKMIGSLLKYCRPLYALYYCLGSGFLRILKHFVRTDERLILFNCFGGKSFGDSPRALYEAMCEDPRFADCRLVWALQKPEAYLEEPRETIRSDTLSYFITALRARVWITNSSLERGLGFTGKHTYFVNTWHGTPLKKMGSDLRQDNTSFKSKNSWNMDLFTTQSVYEAEIFTRAFGLKQGICQVVGLPRNDELAGAGKEEWMACRERLGLKPEQRVLLYAPTFREYEKNETFQCVFAPPIHWERWLAALGADTVILVRAHYETLQRMELPKSPQIRDLSDYPSLNELMIASDILISDYSSIFFDYAILEKPMVCFAYDYSRYEQARGMYFDIRSWLPGGSICEEELLELLEGLRKEENRQKAIARTKAFKQHFVETCGCATEAVLDRIAEKMYTKETTV